MTRAEVFKRNRDKNKGKLICHICSKEITDEQERNAVKEHLDNNSKNNHPDNLDAAHRSCNKKKDPSRLITYLRSKDLTLESIFTHTYSQIKQGNLSIGSVAMARNIHGKQKAKGLLDKKRIMLLTDFIEQGAEVAGVEMKTIETWIPPMTSDMGKYRIRRITVKGIELKYIMTKAIAKDFDSDNQRT